MAYEMVMPYHLHMPSYFLETFTEYPYIDYRQLAAQAMQLLYKNERYGLNDENEKVFWQNNTEFE